MEGPLSTQVGAWKQMSEWAVISPFPLCFACLSILLVCVGAIMESNIFLKRLIFSVTFFTCLMAKQKCTVLKMF